MKARRARTAKVADGERIENKGQLPLVLHVQGAKAYKVISPMHHYSNHTYSDSVDEGSSSDCNSRTPGKISWLRGERCSLSVIRWVPGRFAVFV